MNESRLLFVAVPPVIRIFTFKEGLLSRFGHDLQFTLDKFALDVGDRKLRGRFWTESLRLEGVVRAGRVDTCALSPSDQKKIIEIARTEVLNVAQYPAAELEANIDAVKDGLEIRGTLTMAGRRRALPVVKAESIGGQVVVALSIEPSRWGIRPYRAMAGALRIKDQVDIEVAVEAALDPTTTQSFKV
jgi:hypothetical protein